MKIAHIFRHAKSWLDRSERESAAALRKEALEAHRKAWARGDSRAIHDTRQRLQAATNQCLRVGV